MDQWQPIETAPKDGARIIAFFPQFQDGHRIQIAHYDITEHRSHGRVTYKKEKWSTGGHVLSMCDELLPTHWMPLPQEPL